MAQGIIRYIRDRQSTIASGLAALLIIIGGFLVFNYLSGLNRTKAPSITPEATQSVQPQENQGTTPTPNQSLTPTTPTNHTVARGDSLSSIAKKYYGDGSKWTEIAKANSIANPSRIFAGTVLSIPQIGAPTSLPKTAAGPDQQLAQGSTTVQPGTSYTVQKGDTLWNLSIKAYGSGFEWYKIEAANTPILRNSLGKPIIVPGQVLRIP